MHVCYEPFLLKCFYKGKQIQATSGSNRRSALPVIAKCTPFLEYDYIYSMHVYEVSSTISLYLYYYLNFLCISSINYHFATGTVLIFKTVFFYYWTQSSEIWYRDVKGISKTFLFLGFFVRCSL